MSQEPLLSGTVRSQEGILTLRRNPELLGNPLMQALGKDPIALPDRSRRIGAHLIVTLPMQSSDD